jgi:hypothetical protein
MTTANHSYLKNRKYSYFELLAFGQMSIVNPMADPDLILAELMRLELNGRSADINQKMIEMISMVVAKYHGITVQELTSNKRKCELIRARQHFCFCAVRFMHQSQVARHSGIKRGTIQHSKDRCNLFREIESDYRRELDEITAQIEILSAGVQSDYIRKLSPDPLMIGQVSTNKLENDEN